MKTKAKRLEMKSTAKKASSKGTVGAGVRLAVVRDARRGAPLEKRAASDTVPGKVRVKMTPGDMLRTIRELQEMSQVELAKASGIPQPTLSSLETGAVTLGSERAEKLAVALKVHPAVLLWPQWEEEHADGATWTTHP
jgi:plasmid maintenance system antidote protein VapI